MPAHDKYLSAAGGGGGGGAAMSGDYFTTNKGMHSIVSKLRVRKRNERGVFLKKNDFIA